MISIIATQVPTIIRVFEEGRKQTFFIQERIPYVQAQVTLNIPTYDSILNALPLVTTPNQITQIKDNFVNLKQKCESIKTLINKSIAEIDKVLDKLNRIDFIFSNFSNFIDFVSQFIPLLRTMIAAGQIILAAQVFPIASGTITIKAGELIKKAKAIIGQINALAKIIDPMFDFIQQKINDIQSILFPLRSKLNEILTEVNIRCFYIDDIFLSKLTELELAMAQNPPVGGGVEGPQGTGVSQTTEQIVSTLADQIEPELILDYLENSNKEKFIEYLVENGFTGYQIVKK